ncbi:DUF3263 domain-containing protein [Micromonospora sp. CPCC 205711]|uniref:DUF3263 domain-containing protein n=1 Tax=Micromonospora sp. CPCC 205547 TaxID=3122400 RepID=UPI002FF380B0
MHPADAAPAAADRSEPSPERPVTGRVDVAGGRVPPPRSAPALEDAPDIATGDPERPAPPEDSADTPPASPAAVPAGPVGADALTEREQLILAFEQQWWKHAGAKEQAIRDTFGLSATRYYQLLNALLDRPAALAAEPLLVGRLRRLRSSRARNRRR